MTGTISAVPRVTVSQTTNNTARPRTPSSPLSSRQTPPRIATPPTASLILNSSPESCYLCDAQNPGDFSPTTKFLAGCLLCSRPFCPIHRSPTWSGEEYPTMTICNINHSAYYHECLEEARAILVSRDNSTVDAVEAEAEQIVLDSGIFPSIGEREKTLWTHSPVSDAQVLQLQEIRSIDAQVAGVEGKRGPILIETKDIVGADIAV